MHPFLNIAKRAALSAGTIMLRHLDRIDTVKISTKQRNDFVTEVDLLSEQEIIRVLRRIYPDHGILAEESGLSDSNTEYQWIIDPIDGTMNYLHGFPHFAVSIGLSHHGKLEAGLIYDPVKQEIFTATRGQGALLNDRRIRVRSHTTVDGSLIATGIPASHLAAHQASYMAMQSELMSAGGQIRRTGSAALDLAYVGAGRLDGLVEIGLKPWDMAAGLVIVREAGGLIGDVNGGDRVMERGHLVAGNPKVFKSILQTIRPHLAGSLARP